MDTTTPAPNPEASIPQPQNLPWFQSKIGDSLTPAGRQLLEQYSSIEPSEVENHIYKTRDTAWSIFPWPCIGKFWFINLSLSTHPSYQRLLNLLLLRSPSSSSPTPPKFLDLGCCLGQDLRKLAFDGVPVPSLYGSDIRPEYERVGHELFRDKETFKDRFICADFLAVDGTAGELEKTEGSWDAISIMMFLHLYDWNTQLRACKRILKLLKRESGSLVVGTQSGSVRPGEQAVKPPFVAEGEKKTVFQHSVETFKEMWRVVERDEGVGLRVEVVYEDEEKRERRARGATSMGRQDILPASDLRMLFFTVEVVE